MSLRLLGPERMLLTDVHKKTCSRCKERPGAYVWSCCADGNRPRVVCVECDEDLNELVLKSFGDRRWRSKMAEYRGKHSTVRDIA